MQGIVPAPSEGPRTSVVSSDLDIPMITGVPADLSRAVASVAAQTLPAGSRGSRSPLPSCAWTSTLFWRLGRGSIPSWSSAQCGDSNQKTPRRCRHARCPRGEFLTFLGENDWLSPNALRLLTAARRAGRCRNARLRHSCGRSGRTAPTEKPGCVPLARLNRNSNGIVAPHTVPRVSSGRPTRLTVPPPADGSRGHDLDERGTAADAAARECGFDARVQVDADLVVSGPACTPHPVPLPSSLRADDAVYHRGTPATTPAPSPRQEAILHLGTRPHRAPGRDRRPGRDTRRFPRRRGRRDACRGGAASRPQPLPARPT